jgi:hypothetical protein
MARGSTSVFLAALVAATLGLAPPGLTADPPAAVAAAQKTEVQSLAGSITGFSRKARLITMDVDQSVQTVRFDEATIGLDHAAVGEAAIVEFRMDGAERVATVIKQKLAKLPPGVTEMPVEEMAALVALGPEKGNYFLVDSRPEARYNEGHLPTAVSIPVPKLEKLGNEAFPPSVREKKPLLVFYCGGVT